MNSCNQKKCRNHVQYRILQALLQLLMNNDVQFVCLWCCALPGFVLQINNLFSLVPISAVIHNKKEKRLIWKAIKYKLDSSSNMQFAFFYPTDIQKNFGKLSDLSKIQKSRKQQRMGGGGRVIFVIVIYENAYKNQYVIQPLLVPIKKIEIFNETEPHKKYLIKNVTNLSPHCRHSNKLRVSSQGKFIYQFLIKIGESGLQHSGKLFMQHCFIQFYYMLLNPLCSLYDSSDICYRRYKKHSKETYKQ